MVRLALIGDLHLSGRSPRYAHVLSVLDHVITDALARGVQGFCFLGDVVEQAPAPMEIADLAQRLGAIREGGAWVAIAQGNHEHADCGAIWECLGVMSAWDRFRTMDVVDAVVLLCPYPRRGRAPYDDLRDDGTIAGNMRAAAERVSDAVSAVLEQCDGRVPLLVLGHFTIAGMRTQDSTFEIHSATEPILPVDAFKGVAFVGVGHIHREQWYCEHHGFWNGGSLDACGCGALARDARLRGVGSLIRHSFAEQTDPKSYTLLTVDGGRVTHERIPVPAREQLVYEILWPDVIQPEHILDGAEVKVIVQIPADRVAMFDPSAFDALRARTALFVLEKRVIPVERVRAPEIGASGRIEDQLTTWLEATDQQVDEPRRARLLTKAGEVTT
jgi:hypothetical protein